MLFHWSHVDALANYRDGDVIVDAIDVEEARTRAKAHAAEWVKESYSWWFDAYGELDPDYREEHDLWVRRLDDDLTAEPDVVRAVFITGSE